ncbi:MAG: carbohydrate binding domain-containing protein, partial [Lachnospiraceae bacterium]|nr:carbohydrate binding domain-containing protein [Lachnospiraceae bacterium]
DSEENIYLEDGKLVLRPIKTVDANGNDYYTSGRVNTQNKHDYTYGIFEARLRVPEGLGYLPAFWLMATDENIYGQWPRCGEVDIMEIHGSETTTNYGTIHYGNPHGQSQGTYPLSKGSFSDDFHTFTVEWEPGKISWYVDGYLYHTESDWYSTTEGQGTITYPAPFDQPFYIILNLAVGGSWVGYPDATTDFENARYEIDYVRVYQKDSYDENVAPPDNTVTLREPDENGEYIINGDFAVAEDLTDDTDWKFLLAEGGSATATIANNEMVIDITSAGSVDYGVQLVQPNLPMRKGGTYEITFDAYALEDRTAIVCVSAPDRSWIRYFPDTVFDLTKEKQTYTFQFEMKDDDDANGRLEFNMGNVPSIAGIRISNVSVKMIDFEEVAESDAKSVLADGNYIYNGYFQEGVGRTEFWSIDNSANAEVSVTNFADGRRLMVVAPEGTSPETPVVISQGELAIMDGATYAVSFDIQGDADKIVKVLMGGNSFDMTLTGGKDSYNDKIVPTAGDKTMSFTITEPGTYYLDNVRVIEDSLILNGSFNAGLAGFEPYAYTPNNVTWVVDSLSEDNAIDFTINDTGSEAWHIQLKQNGVELVEGQWYRLSFDAKSSKDRKIMFAIQRDGNKHGDDWTPYSGEHIVSVGANYETFEIEFQMTEATDSDSVLSISMGAVDKFQIKEQHRICIDNILLEMIDAPAE